MVQEQDGQEVDEHFEEILRAIIQEVHNRPGKDAVSSALYLLLVRQGNTWRSIRVLRENTPEELHAAFMVDAGTLLRAMFDAYLQADFIFRDPAKRPELALQYLEFEHVERYKTAEKVLRHDNPIANHLKSSANRAQGEARLLQEFERVKDSYLIEEKKGDGTAKLGTRTRGKWYRGDLSQLAAAASKQAEYDAFVASFSGCVHSSALAVRNGPMIPPKHVLSLPSTLAARVARLNVEYHQLDLGDWQMVLDEFCKSWLDRTTSGFPPKRP